MQVIGLFGSIQSTIHTEDVILYNTQKDIISSSSYSKYVKHYEFNQINRQGKRSKANFLVKDKANKKSPPPHKKCCLPDLGQKRQIMMKVEPVLSLGFWA